MRMRHFLKGAFHKYLPSRFTLVPCWPISEKVAKKNVDKGKHIRFKSPQYDGYLLLI